MTGLVSPRAAASLRNRLKQAIAAHQAGRLTEAITGYQTFLRTSAAQPDIHHLLGQALLQANRRSEGLTHLRRAVALKPGTVAFLETLGRELAREGIGAEALEVWERVVNLSPDSVEAHQRRIVQYTGSGRWDVALSAAATAVSVLKQPVPVLMTLAVLLSEGGRTEQLLGILDEVARLQPDDLGVQVYRAMALSTLGQLNEAKQVYERILAKDPGHGNALNNLASLHMDAHRFDRAVPLFRRASRVLPNEPAVRFNLAHALNKAGELNECRALLHQLLARHPDNARFLWARLNALPIVYACSEEQEAVRTRFLSELDDMELRLRSDGGRQTLLWSQTILPVFHLHYPCREDVTVQRRYGRLVCEIMSRAVPQCREPVPPQRSTGRVRVGFASAYLRHHTVQKLFGGWIRGLDRSVFDVRCFHLGVHVDEVTEQCSKECDRFFHLTEGVESTAACIREQELDVLIYPEIGMDADTLQLAALRLAPVQAMAWGHPVTSGMPTIDYFLSSEWMEPPGGERHYTETLVRLPHLSIAYPKPVVSMLQKGRREFGIPENRTAYLCSQSLYKYQPKHDDVLPQIAQGVASAWFVFLEHPARQVTEIFNTRLRQSFQRYGLDWTEYCAVLPRVSEAEYFALNRVCDVYLDSPGWSGGNTSLEAIAQGLPIVTATGALMRERHTEAMLVGMGMGEWVAENLKHYVELGISLGRDSQLRGRVRAQIHANSERLFEDATSVAGLSAFLLEASGRTGRSRVP